MIISFGNNIVKLDGSEQLSLFFKTRLSEVMSFCLTAPNNIDVPELIPKGWVAVAKKTGLTETMYFFIHSMASANKVSEIFEDFFGKRSVSAKDGYLSVSKRLAGQGIIYSNLEYFSRNKLVFTD